MSGMASSSTEARFPRVGNQASPKSQTWVGVGYAMAAGLSWGLAPLYWQLLKSQASPMEIVAHRVVWSFFILLFLVAAKRQLKTMIRAMRSHKVVLTFALSAILIGTNAVVYISAVNSGRVIEGSLGDFLTPLATVLLGMVFARERLRAAQLSSVLLAAAGVSVLALQTKQFPWLALTMAVTFGSYGLLRKLSKATALVGQTLESLVLGFASLFYIGHLTQSGQGALAHGGIWVNVLLAGGGLVSAIPLLWFSEATKRLPLATIGFFQYVSPSVQFLLAVFVLKERFSSSHLAAFLFIWGGLAVFTIDAQLARRKARSEASHQSGSLKAS